MTLRSESAMLEPMTSTDAPVFNGTRLRQAREEKAWSRGRVAAVVRASVASVNGWEASKHMPRPEMLVKLAEAVGIAPAELIKAPRSGWGMAEFRIVSGQEQRDVAKAIGVYPVRFSHFEAGYGEPTPEHYEALARLYRSATKDLTAVELAAAWTRVRDRLTSS